MLPIVQQLRDDLRLNKNYHPLTSQELYDIYKGQWNSSWNSFKSSLSNIDDESLSKTNASITIPMDYIICQQDSVYQTWPFDENRWTRLEEKEELPSGMLTVSVGGTMPCALYQILQYYDIKESFDSLLAMLCSNGYRKNGVGVLWQTLDVLLPVYYDLDTNIPKSVNELSEELAKGHPIFCLVPSNWGQGLPGETNQSIIIWGIKNGMLLCTNTYQKAIVAYKATDLLLQLKMAWIVSN